MRSINQVTYAREHILTRVNEPRKFSSEFEAPCPSVKLFHLEKFAIYGNTACGKAVMIFTYFFKLQNFTELTPEM